MKNLFTIFCTSLLMMLAQITKAQSWGYAGYGHWIASVNEASDGSVWAAGYGSDSVDWTGESSNYILRLNADGSLIWKDSYDDTPFSGAGEATTILPVAGGGAVVLNGYSGYGPGLYKLNDDGVVLWTNESWYTLMGFAYYYGGQITQLTDGRLIVGGFCDDLYYHFVEVSEDGELLSTFEIAADTTDWGFSYFNYQESGIVSNDDGGFAFSAGNDNSRTLYKFDAALNLVWNQSYPHGAGTWEYNETWLDGLSKTSDGGYLLAGSSADDSFGMYSGTLRKISSTGTLEWLQYFNHDYPYEEGSVALQLDADHYIIWTQDNGDGSTHGWVLDNMGNQVDSIPIPILGCAGYGLETWHASKSADGGYIISGRQYVADCNQRFTIIKSEPDGSLPVCIWNCVWPGDANNDAYATADDLFEIGINYGDEGIARSDMGIDWEGKLAQEWFDADSLLWYVVDWGKKYVDCNGDGIINDDDTSAVINNFGLDHPVVDLKTTAGDIPLYLEPTDPLLHIGLNQIPIYLGDAINSVDEIYGLRFTITVEGEDIDASSLKVDYTPSWFTTSTNRIPISITDADNSRVFTGVVRKNKENTGGNGQIGTLDVVVIDNISGKTDASEVTISFSDVRAINLDREELSIYTESLTYGVEEGSAVNNILDNAITVYPTVVTNNLFTVSGSVEITSIEIADLTGKIVLNETGLHTNEKVISTNDISAGQYIITIYTATGSTMKKIIVQ